MRQGGYSNLIKDAFWKIRETIPLFLERVSAWYSKVEEGWAHGKHVESGGIIYASIIRPIEMGIEAAMIGDTNADLRNGDGNDSA